MPSVFISYRRSADDAEAHLIQTALAGRLGEKAVFLDAFSLAPGSVWPTQLRRALAEATVVIAVIGPNWLGTLDRNSRRRIDDEDDWVRQELAEALASHKRVIPVYVCGAAILAKEAFPESLQGLADLQALELRTRYWSYDVKMLLDQVAPESGEDELEEHPSGESGRLAGHRTRSAAPGDGDAGGSARMQPPRINPYKLFYFRSNRKLSYTTLEERTGIPRATLRLLEKASPARGVLEITRFRSCEPRVVDLLEQALGCEGRLAAGQDDDFLTQYMEFYRLYGGGGKKRPRDAQGAGTTSDETVPFPFDTKAVVFDFDGTLTLASDHRTTWERIWIDLGYTIRDCATLHTRFQRQEITHPEWCNLTRDAFRKRGLTEAHLDRIAAEIQLVPGVRETVANLRKQGVLLYILSGSIKAIIRKVLGDLQLEFEEIKANEMSFDERGNLREIVGTPFDFQGKAVFLRRLIEDRALSPESVLFVGNSCNDIFASQSGVRTLCVNPRFTDPANEAHWTYAISEMNDLKEILEYTQL